VPANLRQLKLASRSRAIGDRNSREETKCSLEPPVVVSSSREATKKKALKNLTESNKKRMTNQTMRSSFSRTTDKSLITKCRMRSFS
jgi:hypothetical protein